MSQKVVIFGGSDFLGSCVVDGLIRRNYKEKIYEY